MGGGQGKNALFHSKYKVIVKKIVSKTKKICPSLRPYFDGFCSAYGHILARGLTLWFHDPPDLGVNMRKMRKNMRKCAFRPKRPKMLKMRKNAEKCGARFSRALLKEIIQKKSTGDQIFDEAS